MDGNEVTVDSSMMVLDIGPQVSIPSVQSCPDDRSGSLQRDFIGTFATSILRLVFSGATGVLLARTLGPVARGEFALMLLWTGALTTLTILGTNEAVAYFAAERPQTAPLQLRAGLRLVRHLVSVGVPVGGVVGALLLRHLPSQSRAVGVGLIAVCMPLHAFLSVFQGYLQGTSRFRSLNLLLLANDVFYCLLACGIPFLVSHNGPALILAVGAFLGTAAFSTANSVRLLRDEYRAKVGNTVALGAACRDIGRYGRSVATANWITFFGTRIDEIVVALFLTTKAVGLYSVAKMAMVGINTVPVALSLVLLPKIIIANQSGKVWRLFQRTLLAAVGVCSAGLALSFVSLPPLVPLVFGSQYRESVNIAQLLVLSAALSAIVELGMTTLKGMYQLRIMLWTRASVITILFIALVLLVPRFGLIGAAAACAFANGTGILLVLAAVWLNARTT